MYSRTFVFTLTCFVALSTWATVNASPSLATVEPGVASSAIDNLDSSSRSLLATCSGSLTVGSTKYQFSNCNQITPALTLYYTLEPSGSGTTFKGGLLATKSTGYNSFAFSPSGLMFGSNAVIIYPDSSSPTGASITGITINSDQVAPINAAKGSFPLSNTAVAKNADGTLSGVFSFDMKAPTNTLTASPQTYIYVTDGPMLANNVLGSHFGGGSDFASNSLTLVATAAPATPTPVATPAATPAVPTQAHTATPTPVAMPATQSPVPVPVPVPTPVTVPSSKTPEQPPSAEPAAELPAVPLVPNQASTGSTTTASPGNANACSVTVDKQTLSYVACYTVSMKDSMKVYYTLEADPLDSTSSILSMAIQGPDAGYISVGFPSNPGMMTDAASAIVQVCPKCPTGASIDQYYMTGYDTSNVKVDKRMNMTEMKASASNGQLYGSFKVMLKGTPATGHRRRLHSTPAAGSYPLIYAIGPVTSSGVLSPHAVSDSGSSDTNLLSGVPGSNSGGEITVTVTTSTGLKNAHSWISTIAWGFMIPMAIFTARYVKPHSSRYWFIIHRVLAAGGYLLAVVGMVIGFIANNGWNTITPVHRDLGMAATVLGLMQMFSLIKFFRPSPGTTMRPYWHFVHVTFGRSATILAIANIYYGILVVDVLGTWAWASYTAVLGAIVVAGLVMEYVNYGLRKNVTADENEEVVAKARTKGQYVEYNTPDQTSRAGSEYGANSSYSSFAEVDIGANNNNQYNRQLYSNQYGTRQFVVSRQ